MPRYCVETSFHVPTYHHTVVEAESPEEACRLALENDDWSDAKQDPESAGETYVSGIWIGAIPYEGDSVEVPTEFEESLVGRATHYLDLLALLIEASYITFDTWFSRTKNEIRKAHAILKKEPNPDTTTEPVSSIASDHKETRP